jgi:hypothetical protein
MSRVKGAVAQPVWSLFVKKDQHRGFVKFDEQTYPCTATNLSATGATLHFNSPVELPETFTLQLTHNGMVSRTCSVIWNEGVQVGVVFDRGA